MTTPITIGLNLTFLRLGRVGGLETYIRQIVATLAQRPDCGIVLFASDEVANAFEKMNVSFVRIMKGYSTLSRLTADNLRLPSALRQSGVDVLFSPDKIGPQRSLPIPHVITIHDLQHRELPTMFSPPRRLARETLIRGTLRNTQHIIAISDYARQSIIREYRVPGHLVHRVYHGVTPLETNPKEERRILERYGLSRPYFIYPAMSYPHKNHRLLLSAMDRLVERDIQLVFTGKRTREYSDVQREISERGLNEHVRHLGFLPHNHVLHLISAARAMVFPSLFEGFGLPIIEAMHVGTPVIVSNRTSIPEIAGNAAVLLDPHNDDAWINAMHRLLDSEPERNDLIAEGHKNARRFSWERCAQETLDVLRLAAQR